MTTDQFISLASIIFGGSISAIVVSALTSQRDLKDYKRKKIEELYEVVRQDSVEYFDWYIRYFALFDGTIPLNDFDQHKKIVGSKDGAERKSKAEMLANLYVPKIIRELETYWEAKKSHTLMIDQMYRGMKQTSMLPQMEEIHQSRLNVDEAKNQFLTKLSSLSCKL